MRSSCCFQFHLLGQSCHLGGTRKTKWNVWIYYVDRIFAHLWICGCMIIIIGMLICWISTDVIYTYIYTYNHIYISILIFDVALSSSDSLSPISFLPLRCSVWVLCRRRNHRGQSGSGTVSKHHPMGSPSFGNQIILFDLEKEHHTHDIPMIIHHDIHHDIHNSIPYWWVFQLYFMAQKSSHYPWGCSWDRSYPNLSLWIWKFCYPQLNCKPLTTEKNCGWSK